MWKGFQFVVKTKYRNQQATIIQKYDKSKKDEVEAKVEPEKNIYEFKLNRGKTWKNYFDPYYIT